MCYPNILQFNRLRGNKFFDYYYYSAPFVSAGHHSSADLWRLVAETWNVFVHLQAKSGRIWLRRTEDRTWKKLRDYASSTCRSIRITSTGPGVANRWNAAPPERKTQTKRNLWHKRIDRPALRLHRRRWARHIVRPPCTTVRTLPTDSVGGNVTAFKLRIRRRKAVPSRAISTRPLTTSAKRKSLTPIAATSVPWTPL